MMVQIQQSLQKKVTPKKQPHYSFTGHETFVFRYAWLKKAVDAIAEDPGVFARKDAIITLGVGKNMVRSIRYWGLATGVLEEIPKSRGTRLRVSTFGQFLLGDGGRDPYLEDPNSLWLLHWRIFEQTERCTTWHWTFNKLPSTEFTRDSLFHFVLDECRRQDVAEPNVNSLKRDIDVFIRTYSLVRTIRSTSIEDSLDCPLAELEFLEESSGVFRFGRGPRPNLSDQVFASTVAEYWNHVAPSRETLAFTDIAYRAGSPGNIFRLDENSLTERLERLDFVTEGQLSYGETAGLRQVYKQTGVNPIDYLDAYYASSNPVVVEV